MVIVSSLFLALLPFVAASRLHKLRLHKLSPANPPAAYSPELEAAYLAEKYGAPSEMQMPLGLGGLGRVRPSTGGNKQLFWTQEELKGGHGVPLASLLHILGSILNPLTPRFFRFSECAVFRRDHSGRTSTNCTSF